MAVGVPLAVVLAPEGRLACDEPYLTEARPDGAWSVKICGRPRFFAMPGGGSDAPGWIVLRDAHGAVRGVSSLSMLQLYGMMGEDTDWTRRRVSRPMVFDLPLDPAQGRIERWWDERIWRLRALAGLTPSDEGLS
ncbi:hypothetical protein [Aurantimonas sp. Leaf443]|uniref:hypothetical protein n=1 Tax=Aurantimonas sp. Leaf443 TaxID=1736378 RepID=UPI0006FF9C6A|nr:hypothetical protein [Aurantimonas sp. Leaf443]KQT86862.1 hypothetical protein ASG48_17665 [Aurantimonas sp. Leaf443]